MAIKQNDFRNKDWEIGSVVSVGFMKGLVVESVRAEYDSMPDIYTLMAPSGKRYEFIPHNGLSAI